MIGHRSAQLSPRNENDKAGAAERMGFIVGSSTFDFFFCGNHLNPGERRRRRCDIDINCCRERVQWVIGSMALAVGWVHTRLDGIASSAENETKNICLLQFISLLYFLTLN